MSFCSMDLSFSRLNSITTSFISERPAILFMALWAPAPAKAAPPIDIPTTEGTASIMASKAFPIISLTGTVSFPKRFVSISAERDCKPSSAISGAATLTNCFAPYPMAFAPTAVLPAPISFFIAASFLMTALAASLPHTLVMPLSASSHAPVSMAALILPTLLAWPMACSRV